MYKTFAILILSVLLAFGHQSCKNESHDDDTNTDQTGTSPQHEADTAKMRPSIQDTGRRNQGGMNQNVSPNGAGGYYLRAIQYAYFPDRAFRQQY